MFFEFWYTFFSQEFLCHLLSRRWLSRVLVIVLSSFRNSSKNVKHTEKCPYLCALRNWEFFGKKETFKFFPTNRIMFFRLCAHFVICLGKQLLDIFLAHACKAIYSHIEWLKVQFFFVCLYVQFHVFYVFNSLSALWIESKTQSFALFWIANVIFLAISLSLSHSVLLFRCVWIRKCFYFFVCCSRTSIHLYCIRLSFFTHQILYHSSFSSFFTHKY